MIQAVILAAGQGSRLGALTKDMPKGLLCVGGRALILHSLDRLSEAGIGETVIVTGYGGEALRRRLGEAHGGMRLTYGHNADFRRGGSMISLLAARPYLRGETVLVLESDILYDPGFIAAALAVQQPNVLLAAEPTGSHDEVFLCAAADGRLTFLGKTASREQRLSAVGEFSGISKVSMALVEQYAGAAETLRTADRGEHHYEEVFFELARRGAPIHVLACPGLPWTEVDNAADLARAEEKVWPALSRALRAARA